jgi:hypothetical protein
VFSSAYAVGVVVQSSDRFKHFQTFAFCEPVLRICNQGPFDEIDGRTVSARRNFKADPMSQQVSIARAQDLPTGKELAVEIVFTQIVTPARVAAALDRSELVIERGTPQIGDTLSAEDGGVGVLTASQLFLDVYAKESGETTQIRQYGW